MSYEENFSQELCLYDCVKNEFKDKKKCVLNSVPLFHNTNDDNYTMCDHYEEGLLDLNDNIMKSCQIKCLPNCYQEIFDYELLNSQSNNNNHWNNDTIINIILKSDDEISYIYRPRMTFTDFFANFGGLLSLWLGLSFVTIYDYLSSSVLSAIIQMKRY